MRWNGLGLLMMAGAAQAGDVQGSLQWSQRVELSTPTSGIVRSVSANVGDRVKKGQVLLALDAAAQQAGVSEVQAAIARIKEEELDAKRSLDRTQELYNRTVLSTSELEAAQTRYAKVKATLAEAQGRLAAHQKYLGDTAVRAPFDALVLARQVEPGQTVSNQFQSQPLLILARAGEMIARAHVALAQVEKMKVGDPVIVSVGGQSYNGKVKALGLEPVSDKTGNGYAVDVLFPVKEVMRAGTPASLHLP